MTSLLYAQTATPAAPGQPSPFMSLLPLLVIFVIFYFLLIRPQQKKMSKHKQLLEALKIGDKVIISGGIFAVVVGLGDTTLEVKIADNVKIKILKGSVTEVLTQEPQTAPKIEK